MKIRFYIFCFIILFCVNGCKKDEDEPGSELQLVSIKIGNLNMTDSTVYDAPIDQPIVVSFNTPLEKSSVQQALSLIEDQENSLSYSLNFFNSDKAFSIYPAQSLQNYTEYSLEISGDLTSADGKSSFSPAEFSFVTIPGLIRLESLSSDGVDLMASGQITNVALDLEILARFSAPVNPESLNSSTISLETQGNFVPLITELDGSALTIRSEKKLDYLSSFELVLGSGISGEGKEVFEGFSTSFFTELDSTQKFPEISDEELLTLVQQQTFKYFWDFGHPVSGLARERNTSGETVTIGGSGFGVMALLVGMERGFISREEGVDRLLTMVNFLLTKADRFHGAWSHWLNGTSGKVRPFSEKDNGGDLVETSFMIQGLLTAREYLDEQDAKEAEIISKINLLWNEVEWDWYTQNGQNVLYWHWSPEYQWEMDHRIGGWNEALIVYVLAASSPTHPIDKVVYDQGWAKSGNMQNGSSYYGINLPLGPSKGGPLFFSHYSFLGLDPRQLQDPYANYWEQNTNHSLINYEYCTDNPKDYMAYSEQCWGLTASDNHEGYSAHSPTNDKGVITPTAAISSLPYTPDESLAAIRHFYYILGDKLWGEYGFYDAFNFSEGWIADSYLAIDQGPIICMIENYRSGLLWDLFMSAPEVSSGLTKLGFTYE